MQPSLFSISSWNPFETMCPDKLQEYLDGMDLVGQCIREIWNVGINFTEEREIETMSVELDEPIILVLDKLTLELLFSDTSLVYVAQDRLTRSEASYQGVSCSRSVEVYLSQVLNRPIRKVFVVSKDRATVDNPFGYDLPEQAAFIDTLVLEFESGDTLNISAWYDYMEVAVLDGNGERVRRYDTPHT